MINYCNIIQSKTHIKPKIILEIGSRDAHDANILKNFFNISDEDVYVVEPNPNQQVYISKYYPNFNLIKNAIYNKDGKLKFNAVNQSGFIGVSSLLDRNDGLYSKIDSNTIKVDVITGDKLLSIIGKEIDLCKIDVEGATYEVLESFKDDIFKIKSIHIECEHKQVWVDQKLYNDVKNYLESKGYVQIYFTYVNNIPLQSDSIWVNKNYLKI